MMKYLAEFLGTFVFLSVILTASTSGAHLNPAVSVMMYLNKSLPAADFIPYVGAQLLGAVAAKMFFDMLNTRA